MTELFMSLEQARQAKLPGDGVYRCPPHPPHGESTDDAILGCGSYIAQKPDVSDGGIDCPCCGIWFFPADEPDTIIEMHDAAEPGDCELTVACVNALSGIADPAAFVAAAKQMRDAMKCYDCDSPNNRCDGPRGKLVYGQCEACAAIAAFDAATGGDKPEARP